MSQALTTISPWLLIAAAVACGVQPCVRAGIVPREPATSPGRLIVLPTLLFPPRCQDRCPGERSGGRLAAAIQQADDEQTAEAAADHR